MLATEQIDIERFVAALRRDYSWLSTRIRELTHSVSTDHDGLTIRLHFPAIAQGKAAVWEMVNALIDYMTPFALHRSQIQHLEAQFKELSPEQYRIQCERLHREAIAQYVRAQQLANKNGELGELLLFVLTEWILQAPQLVAKLPLKTNRDVPSHGTDGIHIGYLPHKSTVCTYWGEAKFYSEVDKAISAAAKSIENSLRHESKEFELTLVRRNIDFSGIAPDARDAILTYLNPFGDENYNRRVDVITCLIGFNFDGYRKLKADSSDNEFANLATSELAKLSSRFSKVMSHAGIKNHFIELFFFPVPSVQELRDLFQSKIGWKK